MAGSPHSRYNAFLPEAWCPLTVSITLRGLESDWMLQEADEEGTMHTGARGSLSCPSVHCLLLAEVPQGPHSTSRESHYSLASLWWAPWASSPPQQMGRVHGDEH